MSLASSCNLSNTPLPKDLGEGYKVLMTNPSGSGFSARHPPSATTLPRALCVFAPALHWHPNPAQLFWQQPDHPRGFPVHVQHPQAVGFQEERTARVEAAERRRRRRGGCFDHVSDRRRLRPRTETAIRRPSSRRMRACPPSLQCNSTSRGAITIGSPDGTLPRAAAGQDGACSRGRATRSF